MLPTSTSCSSSVFSNTTAAPALDDVTEALLEPIVTTETSTSLLPSDATWLETDNLTLVMAEAMFLVLSSTSAVMVLR